MNRIILEPTPGYVHRTAYKTVLIIDSRFSGFFQEGDSLEIVELKENAVTIELTLQVKPRAPVESTAKPPDIGVRATEHVGTRERLG